MRLRSDAHLGPPWCTRRHSNASGEPACARTDKLFVSLADSLYPSLTDSRQTAGTLHSLRDHLIHQLSLRHAAMMAMSFMLGSIESVRPPLLLGSPGGRISGKGQLTLIMRMYPTPAPIHFSQHDETKHSPRSITAPSRPNLLAREPAPRG